jgi:hypothetical protein
MCGVLHGRVGGCNMDFPKWRPEMLRENEYLVLHNYFVFWKNKIFLPKFMFSVRSVFVFNVSLFTSGVCCCQNGLRRKHGK